MWIRRQAHPEHAVERDPIFYPNSLAGDIIVHMPEGSLNTDKTAKKANITLT